MDADLRKKTEAVKAQEAEIAKRAAAVQAAEVRYQEWDKDPSKWLQSAIERGMKPEDIAKRLAGPPDPNSQEALAQQVADLKRQMDQRAAMDAQRSQLESRSLEAQAMAGYQAEVVKSLTEEHSFLHLAAALDHSSPQQVVWDFADAHYRATKEQLSPAEAIAKCNSALTNDDELRKVIVALSGRLTPPEKSTTASPAKQPHKVPGNDGAATTKHAARTDEERRQAAIRVWNESHK